MDYMVFIFSKILTEYVVIEPRVSVRVCVNSTAHTDGSISMKLSTNDLEDICQRHFSRILKIQNGWRHGGHFVRFSFRHSHGRNFAPIFFKIEHKVQSCLPMFAIENQQNRSVTSGNIENRVFEKIKMAAKNKIFEIGQVRCRFPLIQTRWSRIS